MLTKFGQLVEVARIKKGLERKELLKRLNAMGLDADLKSSMFSLYLHGTQTVPIKILIGLSEILDIPLEKLQESSTVTKRRLVTKFFDSLDKEDQKKAYEFLKGLYDKRKNKKFQKMTYTRRVTIKK